MLGLLRHRIGVRSNHIVVVGNVLQNQHQYQYFRGNSVAVATEESKGGGGGVEGGEGGNGETTKSKKSQLPRRKLPPQNKNLENHNIHEAFAKIKEQARARFDETVEVAIKLNVDPRKQTQAVKGMAALPQGLGKKIRVAVFASGADIDIAKRAGAEYAGSDDLIQMVQSGNTPFDRVVATPDMMAKLSKVGKILGPRGLMPNPKLGTVTTDVEKAVKSAKAGSVTFRVDKQGIIHCGIGKVSFSVDALIDNCRSLMIALTSAKPEGLKGQYIKKMAVTSTMGRSVPIDLATVDPNNPKFMLDKQNIAKLGF